MSCEPRLPLQGRGSGKGTSLKPSAYSFLDKLDQDLKYAVNVVAHIRANLNNDAIVENKVVRIFLEVEDPINKRFFDQLSSLSSLLPEACAEKSTSPRKTPSQSSTSTAASGDQLSGLSNPLPEACAERSTSPRKAPSQSSTSTAASGAMSESSSQERRIPREVKMNQRVITRAKTFMPLHKSTNPWKPARKDGSNAAEKDKLEPKVWFIMNRLTPTNFERLTLEMKKLRIGTYEDLQALVNIFFEKVTMETMFAQVYAQLCKVMSGLKVAPPPGSNIKENQATFRALMLTKCHEEFRADKSIIFEDPEEKKKKLESELPEYMRYRAATIATILYKMKLRRMKYYGNIRFMGELFKLGMMKEKVTHDCIYHLLRARTDDSLLSLCLLLTTVGQALDTDKAKPRMDQYFTQMSKIADERKSRIKFSLKDTVELRQNNWIPRKEPTWPKKIDDLHKDFAEEQARNQCLSSQPFPPRNDPHDELGAREETDVCSSKIASLSE